MKTPETKILFFCLLVATLVFVSCRTTQQTNVANAPSASQTAQSPTITTESESSPKAVVDVARLAGKSTSEVDRILGKPEIAKPITEPVIGEYRVYKIPEHPKGLAVRFYGDKAASFNLILSKPLPTSQQALKEIFGIDVKNQPPKIDPKEPLSEVWQGTFNGVKFVKVYAKRERENGGFIFVLAQVAQ